MTRVGSAIHYVREGLPFPLAALHTDNGTEFINELLVPWCRREKIAFTRGRPYKKNDQAYVEQRNWQSVRRHVGYGRYSTKAAYELLLRLYPLLCLQMNFLRPIRKLVAKERLGAKVRKQYDEPRTPYQRLVASVVLTKAAQASLEKRLTGLNPADLQRRINQLLHQLWDLADRWEGCISAGPAWEGELVFCTEAGKPLPGSHLTHRFQALLASLCLPRQRVHDLRHAAATYMLAQGVDLGVVMEVLGHCQIHVTANTYAHVRVEATRAAVEPVDRLLSL